MNQTMTREAPATTRRAEVARAPRLVRFFDPAIRPLLRLGAPLGPNTIITIRGRKSGEPREAAVAVLHLGARRWVVGSFGETNWVRNLRAAGEAEMKIDGRTMRIAARELPRDEAQTFFAETLAGYIGSLPAPARLFGRLILRTGSTNILGDPARAAETRPVFELTVAKAGRPLPS